MFHALPTASHPQSATIGGAFVSCWIERATLEESEQVAREWIASASWVIESLEEAHLISRSDYQGKCSGLARFEQALVDKEVFVFHTYPPGDRD